MARALGLAVSVAGLIGRGVAIDPNAGAGPAPALSVVCAAVDSESTMGSNAVRIVRTMICFPMRVLLSASLENERKSAFSNKIVFVIIKIHFDDNRHLTDDDEREAFDEGNERGDGGT